MAQLWLNNGWVLAKIPAKVSHKAGHTQWMLRWGGCYNLNHLLLFLPKYNCFVFTCDERITCTKWPLYLMRTGRVIWTLCRVILRFGNTVWFKYSAWVMALEECSAREYKVKFPKKNQNQFAFITTCQKQKTFLSKKKPHVYIHLFLHYYS